MIDALRDRHDDRRRLIELIVVEREPENRRYRQPTSENRQRVAVHLDAKRPPNPRRGLRVLKLAVRFAELLSARAVSAGYTAGFVDWRLNKLGAEMCGGGRALVRLSKLPVRSGVSSERTRPIAAVGSGVGAGGGLAVGAVSCCAVSSAWVAVTVLKRLPSSTYLLRHRR